MRRKRRRGAAAGWLLWLCFLLAMGVFPLAGKAAEPRKLTEDVRETDVAGEGEGQGETSQKETSQEDTEQVERAMSEYDFDQVNESLRRLFPDEKLDFKETVAELMSGDLNLTADLLGRLAKDQLTYAFRSGKDNLIHILLIAMIAAVFSNFSSIFQNRQISEVGFYMLYLLLIALCLSTFGSVTDWVSEGIEGLTSFMGVFCPLYFLSVAVAKGSVTAVAFYNLVLFLIYLVEVLIVNVLLPVIHIYIMVKVLNFLSEEDYLSKFAELIEMVVSWTLKTVLTCIVGLNLIQGLMSPAIDTVKRSALTRGAEAIPGIGDAIGGVTEVALGTAVLVKNGIGMAGAVVCLSLCILPLAEIAGIALMYKLAVALIQPVSDKRIVGCVESVGEGCRLLMQVVFTTGLLFLLTIVIVSAVTSSV